MCNSINAHTRRRAHTHGNGGGDVRLDARREGGRGHVRRREMKREWAGKDGEE